MGFREGLGARAAFEQGIAQNVRQTAGGVEIGTGFSTGLTAGWVTDRASVERITKRMMLERGTKKENLVPVRDEMGRVVAYERSVDPVQLQRLNQNTHLAKMLGVWRGRQMEELNAQDFNDGLIDALHAMYEKDMEAGKRDEYINLSDSETLKADPVLADALSLMTPETRQYIAEKFGDEGFWVRRDMLNDTFGGRKASVGDATNLRRSGSTSQDSCFA